MAESPQSTYKAFCEMLRHESAKPVVVRARNFVDRFPEGLSRYDAAEKVADFLTQTERIMFSGDIVVFEADADEQGRTNQAEGLEKMITCRLHSKLFEIDPLDKGEDDMLQKHIDGLKWVETKHLGIPDIEISLWPRVLEELRSMDGFKAPIDKLTCVVNACHVINDVLKRTQAEIGGSRPLSADDFLPLLILACIEANPPRFQSNVEFVAAFRHPSRLNGEHAYWITMLMSAKAFVKEAGPKTLDVSEEDYERLYAQSLAGLIDLEAAAKGPVQAPVPAVETASQTPSDPAPVQQPPGSSEQTMLENKEVAVYQLPTASLLAGQRAQQWQNVIWRGNCSIAAQGTDLAIRMIDKTSGRLFAECLVPAEEHSNFVASTSDSCQHFVLKITNGPQQALIGLGFATRDDASSFQRILKVEAQPAVSQLQSVSDTMSALAGIDFSGYAAAAPVAAESDAGSPADANPPSQKENRRPEVGDVVEVLKEDAPRVTGTIGMRGTITENDYSDMPFKVSLPYGDACWFKAEWIRIVPKEDPYVFLGSTVASRSPCSTRCADPFAEFVDMMSLPEVHSAKMTAAVMA
jgi:hypothetical protein